MRANGDLGDDQSLHCAVLVYMTDSFLIDAALSPHGLSWFDPAVQAASLDHAIWFHDAFCADEWLLCHIRSPRAGRARGLSIGVIYSRDGKLIASTSQECLIRTWDN